MFTKIPGGKYQVLWRRAQTQLYNNMLPCVALEIQSKNSSLLLNEQKQSEENK